ncbi:MAG TPA: ribbon-helix-helix protein, CopG family [Longimicrobiaceae bacterium]|nr:ribbon-helix-helix protein, CopG family [Longimicrobiaceae bacterium]
MSKVVREPIQVYLTPDERAELDRTAAAMGVSRSEVLRRGISAVRPVERYAGRLAALVEHGVVTPPTIGPGSPPPSCPVAPLADLMAELEVDRADR